MSEQEPELECGLRGITPCYGNVFKVKKDDGSIVAVCQGHYEEVFKIVFR